MINLLKFIEIPVRGILDLFYPPLCLHCKEAIETQSPIHIFCMECLGSLQEIPPDFIQQQIKSRLHPCYIDEIYIVFQFDPILQTAIHYLKYKQMPQLGWKLGKYAAGFLPPILLQTRNLLIIPVPLYPLREKERGYNQSEFIARGIFYQNPAPIRPQLLLRAKNTLSQTHLTRQERMENVSEAFVIRNAGQVKESTIVLVDDVITTGATTNECARILKTYGAQKILAVALATPV